MSSRAVRPSAAALLGAALGVGLDRAPAAAQTAGAPAPAEAAGPVTGRAPGRPTVRGRAVDAADGRPVAAALVALRPAGAAPDAAGVERAARTDGDGRFALAGVPAGVWTVSVRRLGYAPAERTVWLPADTLVADLRLAASALDLAAVTVTTLGRRRSPDELFQPAAVLEGAALDRVLTTSVAATVAREPGVWVRTNGPVAAQPVIRGLGGDRVAVLEDGQRMGDVATTAPDHAVTVDPLTARRVEVVRGPAALLYGSNVLGGVVNVVREDVPRERPVRAAGFVAGQGESVNAGGALAAAATAPAGPFGVRAFGTRRVAGDTRTPLGTLPFTDLDAWDAGAGAAWLPDGGARGFAGAAAREVRSAYGVPSSFGGRTLPGAHDGGVYVTLRRTTARADAEWRPRGAAAGPPVDGRAPRGVTSLAASGTYVRFAQDERERGGFVGTRFGQLAAGGDLVARVAHGGPLPGVGAVGVTGQWRDFRAAGSFTGTRPAVVRGGAAYAYDELRLGGRWRLLAGARVDRQRVRPLDSTETRLLAGVRTRDFAAATGALAASVRLARGVTLGAGVARAFRPPAVEELYSAGPHLATYAYEVGNPALRAERGRGADAFLRVARGVGALGSVRGELAAYRMDVRDFVFQAPVVDAATGAVVRDPRLRRYPVYQATQADARLAGGELSAEWAGAGALAGWAAEAGAAVVRGTRTSAVRLAPAVGVGGTTRGATFGLDAARAPLPAMPPARLRLALRRDRPRWFAGAGGEFVARQGRVPAPPAGSVDAAPGGGAVGDAGEAGDAGRAGAVSCSPRAGATAVGGAVRPAEFCPTPGRALLDATAGVRFTFGARLHAVTLAADNLLDAVWRDPLWRAKQVAPQPGRNLRLLYRVEF